MNLRRKGPREAGPSVHHVLLDLFVAQGADISRLGLRVRPGAITPTRRVAVTSQTVCTFAAATSIADSQTS